MTTSKTYRMPLRVVFYYEQDRWIAHCLEFDLIGDGESQAEALECLQEAVRLQVAASVEHDNPDNLFRPADGRYFRMFAEGSQVALGEIDLHAEGLDPHGIEAREYAGDRA